MLTATPFGALPDDTGEFMLGDVLVSVVLMESSENVNANNPNTENWRPETIQAVKEKVVEGVTWWEDTLVAQFPNTIHSLNFAFDFTYADNPVSTDYEPISQISNYFQYWMDDLLEEAGAAPTNSFADDIREFNHSQRLRHDTDWAFTIFVVNDENDADGFFAPGGSFSRAFSFAGGQFIVSPAGRPASTFAHETGHMFWARDEYSGGGSYTDHRGYYDTYNLNAANNPAAGFTQAQSMMATGWLLDFAYAAHASSEPSLEMIGWRDSDGDGVFDVADVPFALSGSGYFDPTTVTYRFLGNSSVQPLFNLNPSGLQNDITMNRISDVQYRWNGGAWQTAAEVDEYEIDLNLELPAPTSGANTIEIRTVDRVTGITSNLFQGDTARLSSVQQPGIQGFVWDDADDDSQYDAGELGLEGWTVRLVDASGQPVDLVQFLDPDDYPARSNLAHVHPDVTLTLPDEYSGGSVIVSTSSGNNVFGNDFGTSWTPTGPVLKMDFATPVTAVRLDAIGAGSETYARLEIYDADDKLLGRYTTDALSYNNVETMSLQVATPEIAYAIASGHGGTGVRLDCLQFGPETSTLTDQMGAYSIASLSAGTYFVEALSPSGVASASGRQTVELGEGEAREADFAFTNSQVSWQNPGNPADVDGDGNVFPVDILLLINFLNTRGNGVSVPSAPESPPPFFDVNDDTYVTAADVLIVITEINSSAFGESEAAEDGDQAASAGTASPDLGDGEGELASRATWASPSQFVQLSPHNADRHSMPVKLHDWVSRIDLSGVPAHWLTIAKDAHQRIAGAHRERPQTDLSLDDAPSPLDDLLSSIARDVAQALQPGFHSRVG